MLQFRNNKNEDVTILIFTYETSRIDSIYTPYAVDRWNKYMADIYLQDYS